MYAYPLLAPLLTHLSLSVHLLLGGLIDLLAEQYPTVGLGVPQLTLAVHHHAH